MEYLKGQGATGLAASAYWRILRQGRRGCPADRPVLLAIWALSAHPKPKTVRSPLLGTRRLSSPFSPPLLVFVIALPAGWLFMVYGLGTTAAWVMGTERTRHGLVLDSLPGYTVKPRRVQLLGRQSCTR